MQDRVTLTEAQARRIRIALHLDKSEYCEVGTNEYVRVSQLIDELEEGMHYFCHDDRKRIRLAIRRDALHDHDHGRVASAQYTLDTTLPLVPK